MEQLRSLSRALFDSPTEVRACQHVHVSGNMPCVACGNVLANKITAEVAFLLQIDVKWAAQHLSSTGGDSTAWFYRARHDMVVLYGSGCGRQWARCLAQSWHTGLLLRPCETERHKQQNGDHDGPARHMHPSDPVSQIYTFDRKTGFLFPIRSEKRFPTSFIKFRSKFKISGKLLKYK